MTSADYYSSDSEAINDKHDVRRYSSDNDINDSYSSDTDDNICETQTEDEMKQQRDKDRLYDLSMINDDMYTSTASTLSVSGGLKVSKKTKVDPLYLQKLIDNDLRKRIPIDAFKQKKIITMIKNTVGIKCKQCGSDNVYVESKQVRSADEAMTKFYTCLNCGNKWRFDLG